MHAIHTLGKTTLAPVSDRYADGTVWINGETAVKYLPRITLTQSFITQHVKKVLDVMSAMASEGQLGSKARVHDFGKYF